MESAGVATQPRVVRPTRRRIRAISVTIGVVLASYALKFTSDTIIVFLLPLVHTDSLSNGSVVLFFIIDVLWPVAPAAMGGMYWLALRGLQRHRVRVVILEVAGFGITFFLGTGVLFNVINVEAIRLIYGNISYPLSLLGFVLRLLIQYPVTIIIVLLLSLFFASVLVKIAQFSAIWPPIDVPSSAKQSWRDFGTIWALTILIAVACQVGFILMSKYLNVLYIHEPSEVYGILLRLIDFFIPIGIVAAIACADTLRALRNKPVAAIIPISDDPFASSDGSFILSFGPIAENK